MLPGWGNWSTPSIAGDSAGVGPAFGVVLQQHRLDQLLHHLLVVGVEVSGGFEGECEGVFGAAFVGVEEEAVGGD